MNDPMLTCPHCSKAIKLTESLAAPLVETMRRQYEQRIKEKDDDVAKREAAVKAREEEIAKAKAAVDDQVAEKLKAAKAILAAEEAKKARLELADQIDKAKQEKESLDKMLAERDAKLKEATRNELALRKERQELQEQKELFELEKQKAIDAERNRILVTAQKNADEQARLKIAEKEKTIGDLQAKLQDALRKAEQGSQQLQGEVLELALEAMLREKFPFDTVEPVAKGEYGGDAVHRVNGPNGKPCGSILWESKRTKTWSDGWLAKLKEDQRAAKAELAIIVSTALPKGMESFDCIDGVWVTGPKTAVALAAALRYSLVETMNARVAGEGQQTKMEMVYRYLTGQEFRHRVQAIAEKFSEMREDLEKEKKSIQKSWAKREKQIDGVITATAGMYGDLQGIAGRSLQEIEGLDLKQLGEGEE